MSKTIIELETKDLAVIISENGDLNAYFPQLDIDMHPHQIFLSVSVLLMQDKSEEAQNIRDLILRYAEKV